MALARRCDQCNKLCGYDKGCCNVKIYNKGQVKEKHPNIQGYNLCPDCMEKLKHWLNGKGKLKEAE